MRPLVLTEDVRANGETKLPKVSERVSHPEGIEPPIQNPQSQIENSPDEPAP